jgi:antitoxin PrlF
MLSTRVGRRGQITLPREVRRRINVGEGDQIVFVIDGGQVTIKPIPRSLLDLRGSVQANGEQDFEAIRRDVVTQRAGRQASHES